MGKDQGDFDWYRKESKKHGVSPRCPFASTELCPKYFDSVEFLGRIKVTTELPTAEIARLRKKWQSPAPAIEEQQPSSLHTESGIRYVSGICPEIGYDIYGHFAVRFQWYPGEDAEWAYARLSKEGVPVTDPRWKWASISPEHYTECRLYSILAASVMPAAKTKRGKNTIPAALRFTVLQRDKYTCRYCGRTPPEVSVEVDHMKSEAEGGKTELDNLVTACVECNRGKGVRSASK